MTSQTSINNTIFNNDFSVNRSTAGTPVVDSTVHTSAAAGSTAIKRQQVPDAAVADPFIIHATATTRSWIHGMDTSDGTSLKEGTAAVGVTTPSTATITRKVTTAGAQTMPLQPAFLAVLTVTQLNVTGAAGIFTVISDTEIFDQGGNYNNATGVFTAPITGRYLLSGAIRISGITATHTTGTVTILTSNRSYVVGNNGPNNVREASSQMTYQFSIIADMDAADTASMRIQVSNGAAVIDVNGSAITDPETFFSGSLLC